MGLQVKLLHKRFVALGTFKHFAAFAVRGSVLFQPASQLERLATRGTLVLATVRGRHVVAEQGPRTEH